jgi:glycogen synthase
MERRIALISYETPYAPCGGIASVMGCLPESLQKAAKVETIVVSPFHNKIPKTSKIEPQMENAGSLKIRLDGDEIPVQLMRFGMNPQLVFLKPEDDRIFSGGPHPYHLPPEMLLRDSLFFGAAASAALEKLDPGVHWQILMQDWEAATTALASIENNRKHDLFLTMHNSYDANATAENLGSVDIDASRFFGGTILQRVLPVIQWPVFTVSSEFARDLIEDDLQSRIMAPHLTHMLRPRLVGIDNGPFLKIQMDEPIFEQMARSNFGAFRQWKTKRRTLALKAIEAHHPEPEKPVWGDLSAFNKADSVWFVMAGRDDSRQKGYDAAAKAVELLLESGLEAQFLFFPVPGDEELDGLRFLRNLAAAHPANVLAMPFIFKEGFQAALQGADFGMMPSFYEPFGMANEFYLNGTPGIGRATGGIIQQIIPFRAGASFSRAVRDRADRWHSSSSSPSGILFRERNGIPSAIGDWNKINDAEYELPDRLNSRFQLPLFVEMVRELQCAILDAIKLREQFPDSYCRMAYNGINHILQTFSWEKSAQEYSRYLNIDFAKN